MDLMAKVLLVTAVCMVLIITDVDAGAGEARQEGLLNIILRALNEEKFKRVRKFH